MNKVNRHEKRGPIDEQANQYAEQRSEHLLITGVLITSVIALSLIIYMLFAL